jgi:hypothetical protein
VHGRRTPQPLETPDPTLAAPNEKAVVKSFYTDPWPILRILRVIFHFCLLGNLAFALASLFQLGNRAGFAVLLAWCVVAYAIIFWTLVYRPRNSLLLLLREKFIDHPHPQPETMITEPFANMAKDPSSPVASNNRYPSPSAQFTSVEYPPSNSIYSQPRPVETDHEEDHEDDEEKQLRIEQEMQRRDVSIVTVPRRQLRITNI